MLEETEETKKKGYYIFIANSIEFEPFTTGNDVTKTLAARGIWLASRFTPYRRLYRAGDHILFYVAGKGARHFIGDAEIAGSIEEADREDIAVAEYLGLDGFREKIPLCRVMIWNTAVPIKSLVEELSSIKDKRYYGLHLRQAAARISEEDYDRLVKQGR